ncbi:TPA: acetyltransferase [Raoultella planticola]|uniref:acetyltransferase n=1 Tax=Raoultella planticola TaxID=575 RepID=UPI001A248FEB|nr:acetyltransferase [Raoultella planticola]
MNIVIRRSRSDESEQLIEIWRRSVDATHHFLSAQDRSEIEQQVCAFFPQAPLWVAVTNEDKPCALMLLSERHLEALFVDPDFRGMGVGRQLVMHALAMIPQLTTDVNEQNTQAVGFYTNMGFVVSGRSDHDDHGRPYPLLHLRYEPR